MVARLSANDHKKLLNDALMENITFEFLEGTMPCRIMLDKSYFNVYVKGLSSAHLKGCADVWRAQLPQHEKFDDMKGDSIPFIFLGYDPENDVYALSLIHI